MDISTFCTGLLIPKNSIPLHKTKHDVTNISPTPYSQIRADVLLLGTHHHILEQLGSDRIPSAVGGPRVQVGHGIRHLRIRPVSMAEQPLGYHFRSRIPDEPLPRESEVLGQVLGHRRFPNVLGGGGPGEVGMGRVLFDDVQFRHVGPEH